MAPFQYYPNIFVAKTQTSLSDQEEAYNACCNNDFKALSEFLKKDKIKQSDSNNPILPDNLLVHAAAANDSLRCLQALVRHGWQIDASVDFVDNNTRTPFRESLTLRGRLDETGTKDGKSKVLSPLRVAVRSMALSAAGFLLQQGAEVHSGMFDDIYAENQRLDGEQQKMTRLLAGAILPCPPGEDGIRMASIWHHALKYEQAELVDLLCQPMAAMRETYIHYHTLEFIVIYQKSSPDTIFDLLLYSGLSTWNELSAWDERRRALWECFRSKQMLRALKIVRYEMEDFCKSRGINPIAWGRMQEECSTGYPALVLIEAMQHDCMPVVNELLEKGISPNRHTYFEHTPIHYIATAGRPAMLQRLLEAGGDVNLRARGPQPGEDYCFSERYEDCEGCNLTMSYDYMAEAGDTPLHALVRFIEEEKTVDYQDYEDSSDVERILVAFGADLDTSAVERVQILLAAGADVNARNQAGQSPLGVLRANEMVTEQAKEIKKAISRLLEEAGGVE